MIIVIFVLIFDFFYEFYGRYMYNELISFICLVGLMIINFVVLIEVIFIKKTVKKRFVELTVFFLGMAFMRCTSVRINYLINKINREQIVEQIEDQIPIKDGKEFVIEVNASNLTVSEGGSIVVFQQDEGRFVGFWYIRGMLNSGSHLFVYSESNIDNMRHMIMNYLGEDIHSIRIMGKNWYYVRT